MSENIQSISQGTFTIGQTSATNFQAGPGISITQPSEGTVRIANDETLLFSASTPVSACTFSESRNNFERLKILFGLSYLAHYIEIPSYLDSQVVIFGKGQANMWMQETLLNINDTGLSAVSGKSINFGNFTSTAVNIAANTVSDENRYVIHQVIGINRISGGNE